ncbi:hypothetical protein CPLU01_02354 [Colletotrichum plurivorum]|uniref:Uncharacterized protein n=1 Tax=Colletotrichum plurivorum TaxID=2175906 RepID=A0A8H6KWP2_9PEZI|nr:hypothetical protein CPLU01_02354 [Colletotrichum plurivorum]
MMRLPCWLLATQLLALVAPASGQSCYWPTGTGNSALKACDVASGNEAAACCFQNHYCTTNGLCLSPTEGTWYRGGCTDKEFAKTGCPKYCDKDDIAGASPGRHVQVVPCSSKAFACGGSGNCPKQNFTLTPFRAVMNLALQTDLANSSTATATATGSASTTTSTGSNESAGSEGSASTGDPSVATCSSTAESSSGISAGAAAGIGAGVGVPLAVAVIVLSMMLLREKKKAREGLAASGFHQQQQYHNHQPGYGQQPIYSATTTTSPWGKAETPNYAPAAEVSGNSLPPELPDHANGRHELPH